VKPLGVRVLIVEPGAFRSQFAANIRVTTEIPDDYKGSITDLTVQAVKNMTAHAPPPGNIEKGAQAIFDVVMKTGQAEGMEEFLRLPLGRDGVVASWEPKLKEFRSTLDGTEPIWSNTDHDA
jgi:hypothetical protein